MEAYEDQLDESLARNPRVDMEVRSPDLLYLASVVYMLFHSACYGIVYAPFTISSFPTFV
jgi:hypothetical protein